VKDFNDPGDSPAGAFHYRIRRPVSIQNLRIRVGAATVRYYGDELTQREVPLVADLKQMKTMADIDAVVAESAQRPVLVFKHSTT
jgi:hypothetical protein